MVIIRADVSETENSPIEIFTESKMVSLERCVTVLKSLARRNKEKRENQIMSNRGRKGGTPEESINVKR